MAGKGLTLTISQFKKLALISSQAIHGIIIVKNFVFLPFLQRVERKRKKSSPHQPPYC